MRKTNFVDFRLSGLVTLFSPLRMEMDTSLLGVHVKRRRALSVFGLVSVISIISLASILLTGSMKMMLVQSTVPSSVHDDLVPIDSTMRYVYVNSGSLRYSKQEQRQYLDTSGLLSSKSLPVLCPSIDLMRENLESYE